MSSTELAPPRTKRYRGAFLRLYRSEVWLLLRRRRNQILLAVLAVIPIFIGVAVKISAPQNGDGPQFIGRITGNGLFLVFTAITVAIPFFLPLIISVVAGDSIAGEAGLGTLRYILTVPVGRGRLLTVKTLAVATFTAIAVLVVAVVGLLAGAGAVRAAFTRAAVGRHGVARRRPAAHARCRRLRHDRAVRARMPADCSSRR